MRLLKNCYINDSSDIIRFVLWDGQIESIKKSAVYKIHDAIVSSFNGKYVSTVADTGITIRQ